MANQSTAITALESKRRKAALESKLRQLRGAFRERDELQIEYMADPNDQIRSSTDREMTIHLLDQQTRLIHDVKSAGNLWPLRTVRIADSFKASRCGPLGSPLRPLPVRSGNRQP